MFCSYDHVFVVVSPSTLVDADLTMIEADKILHLRRCLTLVVVRTHLRSLRCETAASRPREVQCGGYVLGYVQPRHASLRPEIHVTTCSRTYSTTNLQSSPSDVVNHKLMSFCDDVKKSQISVAGLKEVIDLCSKNDYQLPLGTGLLLLKCCGDLLLGLEDTERDYLADQVEHNLFYLEIQQYGYWIYSRTFPARDT